MTRSLNLGWLVGLLLALVIGGLTNNGLAAEPTKKPDPAANNPAEEAKADPFAVPNGTPDEMIAFLGELGKQRPAARTRESIMEFVDKRSQAMLTAADRILAAKPSEQQAGEAVAAKLAALSDRMRLGKEDAQEKLEALPAEVEKAGLKELVRPVRQAVLEGRVAGAPRNKQQIAKLMDEVSAFIKEGEVTPETFRMMQNAARLAEQSGETEMAIKTYTDFAKILADSGNKELAELAVRMEGAARRAGLVGKAMLLEGKTLDGKVFDWSKYKGKVVLIDFFATWCGPCRAETPNIVKNYDAYKERGFDVVVVSLDEDKAALEKYLEENKHDWTVLHENPAADAKEKSMSAYYGVFGIPQLILVGADGKVVSTTVRGAKLGKELAKLLGPADDGKTTDDKGAKDQEKSGG